jgi:aryl-alcohol dehydrogenase-like predicted oxidoreductase
MEYRQLGNSGLRVSTLTLGTMGFGGTGWAAAVGKIDVEGARRQISMALDAGVNLIDTADVYSAGLSEEIVGKALPVAREDVLIASKVRMAMGDGPNDAGLSRHHVIRGCEASLRRLGTDYLDLYQVHEWDGHTPLEETLSALDYLVSSGKVRYIGASNYAAWPLMKASGARWPADCSPESTGAGSRRRPAADISASGANRRSTTRTSSTTPSTYCWKLPAHTGFLRPRSALRGRSAGPG